VRKIGFVLVCLAGLPWIGGASAATTAMSADPVSTTTPNAASTTPDSDPDKIVCKQMPPPTGSRIGSRRECHTQAEWDQMARNDQEALARSQAMGYQQNPGSGH